MLGGEDAVNVLNQLESTARKMVDLPHATGAARCGVNRAYHDRWLALPTGSEIPTLAGFALTRRKAYE